MQDTMSFNLPNRGTGRVCPLHLHTEEWRLQQPETWAWWKTSCPYFFFLLQCLGPPPPLFFCKKKRGGGPNSRGFGQKKKKVTLQRLRSWGLQAQGGTHFRSRFWANQYCTFHKKVQVVELRTKLIKITASVRTYRWDSESDKRPFSVLST